MRGERFSDGVVHLVRGGRFQFSSYAISARSGEHRRRRTEHGGGKPGSFSRGATHSEHDKEPVLGLGHPATKQEARIRDATTCATDGLRRSAWRASATSETSHSQTRRSSSPSRWTSTGQPVLLVRSGAGSPWWWRHWRCSSRRGLELRAFRRRWRCGDASALRRRCCSGSCAPLPPHHTVRYWTKRR